METIGVAREFRLKADMTFEADDIDDAFLTLADHFTMLRLSYDTTPLELTSGEIDIHPVKETTHG
jgi:hypothetical protein